MPNPRIGVFLCDCGKSLKSIDFALLMEKTRELEDVCVVRLGSSLCLEDGLDDMRRSLETHGAERMVVAACAPATREKLFLRTARQANIPPEAVYAVPLRERCTWVHPGTVTAKALEMLQMGLAQARFGAPPLTEDTQSTKRVLVIGGSDAGRLAAREAAGLGLETVLVGAENSEAGTGMPGVSVMKDAPVESVAGSAGHFRVTLGKNGRDRRLDCGAVVVAVGQTDGTAGAGLPDISGVVGRGAFLQMLGSLEEGSRSIRCIAFMGDSGGGASRRSSFSAVSCALAATERLGVDAYVLMQNVEVDFAEAERLYRRARDQGVVFLKYRDQPVMSSEADGRVRLELEDVLLGERVALVCDLVVLPDGVGALSDRPNHGRPYQELAALLDAGVDPQGFLQEDNVHLYPVSSRRSGVYFCGDCRGDLDIGRIRADAANAALSAYGLLSRPSVCTVAEAKRETCAACLTCVRACPHGAIHIVNGDSEEVYAAVDALACQDCGVCAAVCPAESMQSRSASDEQLLAQIECLDRGRLVAFCCVESACQAADRAGRMGFHYPEPLRIIPIPCAGRLDPLHIMKALERGAAGVMVFGCQEGACRHLEGNLRAKARVAYARGLAEEAGVSGERIRMVNLSAEMARSFVKAVQTMWESLPEGGAT